MVTLGRIFVCVAVAGALIAVERRADACAACECGDPTLTTMGNGKPFEGRFRLSTELRHRTDTFGRPAIDELRLSEQRVVFGAAWTPVTWLSVSATLPVVRLDVEHMNLAREEVVHLGDAELRAKAYVWQDRAWSPRHIIGVQAGLKLPTGPEIDRPAMIDDFRLESQPGSGSFDPIAGVSYGYFADPWSGYASATVVIPTTGYQDTRSGVSLRSTLSGQYQHTHSLAYRVSIDTRLDEATTEDGEVERDTGGFIAFAAPEIAYSPVEDLLVNAYVRIPFYNALDGRHDEGIIVGLGAIRDF